MAPANVRNNPATQQREKRNSTSPGDEDDSSPGEDDSSPGEEGSSPREVEDSSPKRPRPSPSGGDHQNPPGPPQNQPPMNAGYQTMLGFDSPMSPGTIPIPTPSMMNNPVHMTPGVGLVGFSSSWGKWC